MSDSTIPESVEEQIEALTTEARERWGEEWFVRIHMDSEGDADVWVIHTVERVADGVVIRDVLTDLGGWYLIPERVLYDLEEPIANVGKVNE